jgi:hypothetical protein
MWRAPHFAGALQGKKPPAFGYLNTFDTKAMDVRQDPVIPDAAFALR